LRSAARIRVHWLQDLSWHHCIAKTVTTVSAEASA
jgi:hypothetical protein